MSIAMTFLTTVQPLLTRIGKAIGVRSPAAAVRRDGSRAATPAWLVTTADPWIAEEQWLAGCPANRCEHFGWLWWQDS